MNSMPIRKISEINMNGNVRSGYERVVDQAQSRYNE